MDALTEPARLAERAGCGVLDPPPEGVLDPPPEPAFDGIVQAAAEAIGVPTALVSLLDEDRQWFTGRGGVAEPQTARDRAFCEYVLRSEAPLVVPDASLDPRFAADPIVSGSAGIRFYAGFPLRTAAGAILGTLCVLGSEPRPEGLTPAQDRLLTVLAAQVMAQLELRRALAQRDAALGELAAAALVQARVQEDLRLSEGRFRILFDNNPVGQVELSPQGIVQQVNTAFARLVGLDDPALLIGHTPDWAIDPQQRPEQARAVGAAAAAPGHVRHTERTLIRPDGTPVEVAGTIVGIPGPDGRAAVLIGSVVDVTERNTAQHRLAQLAAELADARDDAQRRNALTETILATVGVGIVACDADGHLTLFNRATRDFHGMNPDPMADPADLARRYALFEQDGTTPLAEGNIPLFRALRDGIVEDAVIVIAPDGLPSRVVRCDGRAMHAPDGALLGAVVVMTDITGARRDARLLAEKAEFTRVLLDTAHTAIWSCDLDGRPTYFNAHAREALGWPDLQTLVALHDRGEFASLRGSVEMLDPNGQPVPLERRPLHRALAGKHTGEVEVVLAAVGRPRRTFVLQASPLRDVDGAISGAMLTGHDVTDLRESEARFRAAFVDGPTPTARLDRDGVVQEINPALRRLTGQRTSALLGRRVTDHVHPDDADRLQRVLAGPGTGPEPAEVRLTRADGSAVWCELATTASTTVDGVTTVLAQFLDVHVRKAQEAALAQAAGHDPLTSLANRRQLTGVVQAALNAGLGLTAGLLFLDLDHFKAVNDVHGHDAGDAVLIETASRLAAAVRPGDTVLRLGGDEFLVVCTLPADHPQAPLEALAGRLAAAVRQPVAFRGSTLTVNVSVGIAVARPGQDPASLLEDADRAMYQHKAGTAGR